MTDCRMSRGAPVLPTAGVPQQREARTWGALREKSGGLLRLRPPVSATPGRAFEPPVPLPIEDYFLPCSAARKSTIFAASASEIQSAFFPCISLTMLAHFSFVSVRTIARSMPWQTPHFVSKRVLPSDAGAAGAAAAGSRRLGGFLLAAADGEGKQHHGHDDQHHGTNAHCEIPPWGNDLGVSYSASGGDSTVPWRHHV